MNFQRAESVNLSLLAYLQKAGGMLQVIDKFLQRVDSLSLEGWVLIEEML